MSVEHEGRGGGDAPRRRPLLGDETELFSSYHRRLVRTVQRLVNTSPDIVDDACNFAWAEFIRCQPDRERAWRSWLITTAVREAWRLHAKEAGHVGLELRNDGTGLGEPVDPRDTLALRAELRAALDLLAAVPERRRRVKALQVTGFKYVEIGAQLGLGYTRVNHLVAEANAAIRRERERVASEPPPQGRAGRLQELERDPPAWLIAAIGRPPGKLLPAQIVLTWRRAALAIDDYRRQYGARLGDEPLGTRPAEPRAARSHELAERAMERAREARRLTRRRSLER